MHALDPTRPAHPTCRNEGMYDVRRGCLHEQHPSLHVHGNCIWWLSALPLPLTSHVLLLSLVRAFFFGSFFTLQSLCVSGRKSSGSGWAGGFIALSRRTNELLRSGDPSLPPLLPSGPSYPASYSQVMNSGARTRCGYGGTAGREYTKRTLNNVITPSEVTTFLRSTSQKASCQGVQIWKVTLLDGRQYEHELLLTMMVYWDWE